MDLSLEEFFDLLIALVVSMLFLGGNFLIFYNQIILTTIERVI